MHFANGCADKSSANLRNLLLISGLLIACTITCQTAIAAWGQPYNEIVAEQPPPQPAPPTPTPSGDKPVDPIKLEALRKSVIKSAEDIDSLRFKNQAFSISFIVAGITLTLITTSLGAVESQNADVKKWTKFAIVGLGAAAVAAQSLNAAFPVTKRAAEYADIEWNLKSLENKLNNIATENELKPLITQYSDLLERSGKAESGIDQSKKK
jgi:hypothetical protein